MSSNFVASVLMALGTFNFGVYLGVQKTNNNLKEDVRLCIEGHKPSCDKLEEKFRIKEWRTK